MWHHQRGNRLSQQACYRYEREQTLPDDGSGEPRKSAYAVSQLISHRILHNGTVFASIETVMQLHSPVDYSVLATVRQITSVDRVQPRIHIQLTFEEIKVKVKGNPWLTYFGARFAWENEAAAISRAVLGQVAGFRGERFESPDYVEICDMDHRVAIMTHGRPYHRRSGPRMLDSMLIVEGESARTFEFTMDFEQPFPLRSALDVITPPMVQHTVGEIPSAVSSSWVLGVSSKNVELVEVRCVPGSAEKSASMRLLLSETDGSSTQCLLKTARRPTAAFMVNAEQTEKVSLDVTDQGVAISLNPFQIRGVELVF
jgi:alpha-mannosidase